MNIAIIILAAGSSSRLGQPKQLLRRGNQSILEYIFAECIQSTLGPVYIVTGKYHQAIAEKINKTYLLHNRSWKDGMSSSIAFAINEINHEAIDGVIIALSDQVYFDNNILREIAKVASTPQYKIINCKYQTGIGPPTYFHKSLFKDLVKISGDDGAKSVVKKYIEHCTSIDFPQGDIDIDTPSDLKILRNFQ